MASEKTRGRMKFEVVGPGNDLVIDRYCSRCGRLFLKDQRVRVTLAGPGAFQGSLFVIPGQKVNQYTEHENIDDCTEPR